MRTFLLPPLQKQAIRQVVPAYACFYPAKSVKQLDNIFADWAVLDHIHDAQQQVEGTRDQIDSVLIRLRTMEQDTVRELAEVEAERERLLTQG